MRIRGSEPSALGSDSDVGVGEAAKQVVDHAKNLVSLEVELASLELKRKVAALGAGAVLLGVAAVLALYGLGFLLATGSAALDTVMPRWLAHLAVGLVLIAIAGILALLGTKRIQRGTPPTPEQALHEARLTTEALRGDGRA